MAEHFAVYWSYQGDKDKHYPHGGEGQEGEADIKYQDTVSDLITAAAGAKDAAAVRADTEGPEGSENSQDTSYLLERALI